MRAATIISVLLPVLLLILMTQEALALGVGVVPDRITLDEGAANFKILNPNDAEIEFNVTSKISCTPQDGKIDARSEASIHCEAEPQSEEEKEEELIIVETAQKIDGETVGLLPAIAIKAYLGENNEHPDDNDKKTESRPLEIGKKEENQENTDVKTQPNEKNMTAETMTIILLSTAIMMLLIYTEIKKRKEEKQEIKQEKEKNYPNAPAFLASREASQAGQSSASG